MHKNEQIKTAYIAGKITGDPNYKEKFEAAQRQLEKQGYKVMTPAVLTEGFSKDSYLPICFAMIDACLTVVFLPDWEDSKGAKQEMEHAISKGKDIEYFEKLCIARCNKCQEKTETQRQRKDIEDLVGSFTWRYRRLIDIGGE